MSARKKNQPLFRKKNQPGPVLKGFLLILLLIALVVIGFLLGEPLLSLFEGGKTPAVTPSPEPEVTDPIETEATTPPTTTEEEVTTTLPPEPEAPKNGMLRLSFEGSDDFSKSLNDAIAYALENNYQSISVELVANGGVIYFTTSNELAINCEAVAAGALSLNEIYSAIAQAGIIPYAEISALTDHIVSWVDKSICYLFEDSTSKWLDNSAAKGGKPWISAFSQSAKNYIGSFVTEISNAGFAGVIANDVIFPPFRNSDLNYIGDSVKSADRYTALAEFANSMHQALGSAKSFAVMVNAEDIIAQNAEVLNDTSLLTSKTVYVYFNSAELGDKIVRGDGTAVSFAGLSDYHKVKTVFKLVNEALKDKDVVIIPAIESAEPESLITALTEMGYNQQDVLVFK
ncbi:MAG: hypothetical protein IJ424_01255 [Oscillospiraceae bacterium]|nr:hypothetical protein [Oscillospiraceae bacterium]